MTGAPPPVLGLTIDPKTWTNQPDFKLSWETPNWDKQRELLGLVLETDDGFQSERQFFPFPTGDTLVTVTYKAADAGEFDLKVWLVDELGNESSDSARSVKAYFDNVPPSPIMVYSPNTYIPQDGSAINWFYSSDTPRFEWDDAGDYPSGIKKWILWTQKQGGAEKVYGEYTDKDVTFNDGNVILEDDVEIGANCTLDRATLGSTILKKGVKLDNLVMVAHNVEIGESTVIAACVGIAGSSTIGKNCMIGGQAGISGHLKIGDRVMIQAKSGVFKNIKSDTSVMGTPAINYLDYNKSYVHFKNLPSIMKSLNKFFKNNKDA